MHRYWFAVQCGPYLGTFQGKDAYSAASMAILHWSVESDDRCSGENCRVTVVVPAGGQPLGDYEFILTDDLLRSLRLPRGKAKQHRSRQGSAGTQ